MRIASYAMIPIGAAGLPWGVYEITHGEAVIGVAVAVLGCAAATLAFFKIRVP